MAHHYRTINAGNFKGNLKWGCSQIRRVLSKIFYYCNLIFLDIFPVFLRRIGIFVLFKIFYYCNLIFLDIFPVLEFLRISRQKGNIGTLQDKNLVRFLCFRVVAKHQISFLQQYLGMVFMPIFPLCGCSVLPPSNLLKFKWPIRSCLCSFRFPFPVCFSAGEVVPKLGLVEGFLGFFFKYVYSRLQAIGFSEGYYQLSLNLVRFL